MQLKPQSSPLNGRLWGARARDWAALQEIQCIPVYEAVMQRTAVGPGTRYLDVGCGAGTAAHMAAALARPLVVIFGSSSSPIWGPWPQHGPNSAARVVQNPFECNPCPGDHCYKFAQPECIFSVSFDQVKNAIAEVLAHSS